MAIRFSLLLLALCILLPSWAQAQPIVVRNGDWPGLVAAFEEANTRAQEVIIQLAPRGVYLRRYAHQSPLPELKGRVLLIGNGAQLRTDAMDGAELIRIASSGQLQAADLVLAGSDGPALYNAGNTALWQVRIEDNFNRRGGGAVENHGHLSLDECLVGFNTAQGSDAVAGILNFGRLTLVDSLLRDNRVFADRGSQRAVAALLNLGHARILRSRMEGNEAEGPEGAASGVLANVGNGVLEVVDSALYSEMTQAIAALPGDSGVAWTDMEASAR